jgi:hypothetical protein
MFEHEFTEKYVNIAMLAVTSLLEGINKLRRAVQSPRRAERRASLSLTCLKHWQRYLILIYLLRPHKIKLALD